MKRTLYLNCFAGISGDMMLGLLLDLLDETDPGSRLAGLALDGWRVTAERGLRSGLSGVDVKVLSDEGHVHRGLSDVLDIIGRSDLSPAVADRAARAFRMLAQAEGAVHGLSPEAIHFHEVGAVDALVDIVGALTLMEALSPDAIVASSVNVGGGTVRCAHGELPVPAPATLKLLEGVPVHSRGEAMERTTPTGAVLLRLFVDRYGPMPDGVIVRSGYGLGDRDSDLPNLLQGVILDVSSSVPSAPSPLSRGEEPSSHHGHSHAAHHHHGHEEGQGHEPHGPSFHHHGDGAVGPESVPTDPHRQP